MGLMTKMRDNTGVILWILVVAFGIIFMLQDTNVFDVFGTTGNVIAKVNGQDITLDEYNNYINNQVEAYRQQTGESIPPQLLDAERDRVFDELVNDRLREQEMNRLGIQVTDDEVRQMVLGDEPHQIIKTFFGDGQGNVDQAVLRNFIENPDARQDLIRIEDYLRTERRREKLERLIDATVRVSDEDVFEEYRRQNTRVDVDYVALPYAAVPDSVISITDRDLRRYYDDHKPDFERKKSFSLLYVKSPKVATATDSAAVREELQRIRQRFADARDDSLFLAQNFSERPYTDAFFQRHELDDEIGEAVFASLQPGTIVGPVVSGSEMHLVKILEVRGSEDRSINARHILIRAPEGDTEKRTYARELAQTVMDRIRSGESFAKIAEGLSDDPSSAQRGGDLGWFGKGRMVKPFEDAAFGARLGQVVGPVETQFGFHVVEVTAQSDREARIADYALKLTPSVATINRIEENLEDLKFFAEEEGDFRAEADRRGLVTQSVLVEADQQFIPGIGNSRALQNFLAKAAPGQISPVIELNDDFMVAAVERVDPAGFRPFDAVKAEIEPRVRLEKRKSVQVEKMRRVEANDLQSLAAAVGGSVKTASGVSASNVVVEGLGREPKFVGAALGLAEGETSAVIAGQSAAFRLKVNRVSTGGEITQAERSQIRERLLTQRRSQLRSSWLASLREKADITDNRRIFLQ